MLSLEGFVYILTSMFLFTVMTTGVVAGFRILEGCFRGSFCGRHGDTTSRIAAAGVVVVSLMAMPSVRLMEIPLLNVIPLVLYSVYMVLGLCHLWLWRREILALVRRVCAPDWICRTCGERCRDKPGPCGCDDKKKPCPPEPPGDTPAPDRKPCPCGCGGSSETGCGGKCPDRKPGDCGSGSDPCASPPPRRWDDKS